MTLAHIQNFDTDNPEKLGRQLSALEDNVAKETAGIRSAFVPVPGVVTLRAVALLPNAVAATPDQQLSVDTGQASAKVVFPPLAAANFGRPFRVIKRVAANSIVCQCPDASVTYNGGAFPTLTAIGVRVFYCDASGYYS